MKFPTIYGTTLTTQEFVNFANLKNCILIEYKRLDAQRPNHATVTAVPSNTSQMGFVPFADVEVFFTTPTSSTRQPNYPNIPRSNDFLCANAHTVGH